MGQPPELLGILVQQGAQGTAWNTGSLVPRDHPLSLPLGDKGEGRRLGDKEREALETSRGARMRCSWV